MNEQAIENVLEVREEAHQMLENLTKVRGERYARLVKGLLLGSNVVEIYAATASMGDLPEDVRQVLGDAMCKAVYGLISNLAICAEFTPDDLSDATRDASVMESSITGLMKEAVRSGVEGAAFGGRGAR